MEKGGLAIPLGEAGLNRGSHGWHCDARRLGLWGQVRRRWGRTGVQLIQPVQPEVAWQSLVLAVAGIWCALPWAGAPRLTQAHLIPIFTAGSPDAVIWDGASAQRSKGMGERGFARIFWPPSSPELNPPERILAALRREIEGQGYPSLEAKRLAIEQQLPRLRANQTQLRQLIGCDWIRHAFEQLPDP